MKPQIPCGPDDEMCHRLWEVCSKVCYNPETKVRCKLWKEFRGTDATGQECNGWFCVDEMAANMIMEVAKETRQAGAATESFRNVMVQLAVDPEGARRMIRGAPVTSLTLMRGQAGCANTEDVASPI